MATKDLSNPLSLHDQTIILGAGSWYIDRYADNGDVRGAEEYVGDTVAAELSATAERTTVFSGDGATASKLVDRVRSVDRTLSITPQDVTLDNLALFALASRPTEIAARTAGNLVTTFNVPDGATERTYFQLGASAADPAGRPSITIAEDTPIVLASGFQARAIGATAARAAVAVVDGDFDLDAKTGRLRFTSSGLAKFRGKDVEVTIASAKVTAGKRFSRVTVAAGASTIRVAARYIEAPDDGGAEGRNIYVPRAVVSPSGAAALKSRDTPQQWPITLGIEDPGAGLSEIYIDGVPA